MAEPAWYTTGQDPTSNEWAVARAQATEAHHHWLFHVKKTELWRYMWILVISSWPDNRDDKQQEIPPTWFALAAAENCTLDSRGWPVRWLGVGCPSPDKSEPHWRDKLQEADK